MQMGAFPFLYNCQLTTANNIPFAFSLAPQASRFIVPHLKITPKGYFFRHAFMLFCY
jgi:hypothetical protein